MSRWETCQTSSRTRPELPWSMRHMLLRIERPMRIYDLQYLMGFFLFSSSEHEEWPGKNSEKKLKEEKTLGKTMQENSRKNVPERQKGSRCSWCFHGSLRQRGMDEEMMNMCILCALVSRCFGQRLAVSFSFACRDDSRRTLRHLHLTGSPGVCHRALVTWLPFEVEAFFSFPKCSFSTWKNCGEKMDEWMHVGKVCGLFRALRGRGQKECGLYKARYSLWHLSQAPTHVLDTQVSVNFIKEFEFQWWRRWATLL